MNQEIRSTHIIHIIYVYICKNLAVKWTRSVSTERVSMLPPPSVSHLQYSAYTAHTHDNIGAKYCASDWICCEIISDKNNIEVTSYKSNCDIALHWSNYIVCSSIVLCTKYRILDPIMFQIHSITARTVPLEFRETLKKGKPVQTDSILRLQDLSD